MGSPKECTFGGVRRARISSQALKRAMRRHPSFQQAGGGMGVRTRQLKSELASQLSKKGIEDERKTLVKFLMEKRPKKEKDKKVVGCGFDKKKPRSIFCILGKTIYRVSLKFCTKTAK